MEPMVQCNPPPRSLYFDDRTPDGIWNPPFALWSDGCVWNIPDLADLEWVQSVVLDNCRNMVLDLDTNKYQPRLLIKAEASPLVKETIAHTVGVLGRCAFTLVICFSLDLILYLCCRKGAIGRLLADG